MTAYEYLSQARRIDERINSKIQQLECLNELARKCTSSLSAVSGGGGVRQTMSDTVVKIVDLQKEIDRDIDTLVDLKAEIMAVIKAVENVEYQVILEKRYLCFLSWEQISVDLGHELRYTQKLHTRALAAVKIPEKTENN